MSRSPFVRRDLRHSILSDVQTSMVIIGQAKGRDYEGAEDLWIEVYRFQCALESWPGEPDIPTIERLQRKADALGRRVRAVFFAGGGAHA